MKELLLELGRDALEFEENFTANKNFFVSCGSRIIFGNNVMSGWNVNIRDLDGHCIIENGIKKKNIKLLKIEYSVWVCSYVDILKGVKVENNSVIAYGSKVLGEFKDSNLLIGGFPAKVIKKGIYWER